MPKNILERHIEMEEHKLNKRHNTEPLRNHVKTNFDKFLDRFDGRELKKEGFSGKEFVKSKKDATDLSDIKVPRIDTTNLFKNKKWFFPQKPTDSERKKEENTGSKKIQDGDKNDESRSSFNIFYSTPLADICQQMQGDEASHCISKFGNSYLGYFCHRKLDDGSKKETDDGYSSRIEVNDLDAMSDHKSIASNATQEPFQFRSRFEEAASASIAPNKWKRSEDMSTRQHYVVQNFGDPHKEANEANAERNSETLLGNHFAMPHEARETEAVFQNLGMETQHSNQRRRIMSCNVAPEEFKREPFVGTFNGAAPMQSTSWAGHEMYSSRLSFNEIQNPDSNVLLLSHPYSNYTTNLKRTWEIPEDSERESGCLRSGFSNIFWDGSEENPSECLEKELKNDVVSFEESIMNSQREYHLGSETHIPQGQQLSIDSIENDGADNIADSDMKSLGLEQLRAPNGKLDVRMPSSYQAGLLMKPNSMEDDSEEDRFRQEMYKKRSNSRVPVKFRNEGTLQMEQEKQFGSPCNEDCTEKSKELCPEGSPNISAYEVSIMEAIIKISFVVYWGTEFLSFVLLLQFRSLVRNC